MKLLGITGGVGMGKSTTVTFLATQGISVVDTDIIARQLVGPGQPALREIATVFGPSILSPIEGLDRKEMARIVFKDATARAKLEAILHPKIRQIWEADVKKWRAAGLATGAVVIPLLFETRAESQFDAIICVVCSAVSQYERLQARGWTRAGIQQRLEAQWPTEEKISRSDFVIWTDTTLEAHSAQLERALLRSIRIAKPI
jgi:dephospho-CoA kinase